MPIDLLQYVTRVVVVLSDDDADAGEGLGHWVVEVYASASFLRWVTPQDAMQELVLSRLLTSAH